MPLEIPGSWRGVRNRYLAASEVVREYFQPIPALLEEHPWEVSMAFAFSLLERALNTMLYAGTVKLHKAHHQVAHRFVDRHRITRKNFPKLFRNVFGVAVPPEPAANLRAAERFRDRVMHGKDTEDRDKRFALVAVLDYAERMNEFVDQRAGFKPFSNDRRGYTGARAALDESTTAWLMRGLGFAEQDDSEDED